jgi:hypothetical protein
MQRNLVQNNLKVTKLLWGSLGESVRTALKQLTSDYFLSVALGDLCLLDSKWYVTHSGLLKIARRNRCAGIRTTAVESLCNPNGSRWAFKAIVYKSRTCKGFVGYGDADPSNVSPLVRGAEMRVAETRAVNRALRKAYGIGICSVEEIGCVPNSPGSGQHHRKIPVQSANGSESRLQPRLRDRLCQLIRQHQLDAVLVKSYALEFCGTKTLNEASREQIEQFVKHLSDAAAKDKNALLSQLSRYVQPREGAA